MATQKQIEANRKNAKNAGRKPGTLNASTLDKLRVAEQYRQKVLGVADILFRNKLHLAQGVSYLYKVEKYYKGTGKNRKLMKKKPKLVTAQWEIEAYLEERIVNGDIEDPEDTYYYITTDKPSGQAIEDMLDRGIGKVAQAIKAEDENGKAQPITGFVIIREDAKKKDK